MRKGPKNYSFCEKTSGGQTLEKQTNFAKFLSESCSDSDKERKGQLVDEIFTTSKQLNWGYYRLLAVNGFCSQRQKDWKR